MIGQVQHQSNECFLLALTAECKMSSLTILTRLYVFIKISFLDSSHLHYISGAIFTPFFHCKSHHPQTKIVQYWSQLLNTSVELITNKNTLKQS